MIAFFYALCLDSPPSPISASVVKEVGSGSPLLTTIVSFCSPVLPTRSTTIRATYQTARQVVLLQVQLLYSQTMAESSRPGACEYCASQMFEVRMRDYGTRFHLFHTLWKTHFRNVSY